MHDRVPAEDEGVVVMGVTAVAVAARMCANRAVVLVVGADAMEDEIVRWGH